MDGEDQRTIFCGNLSAKVTEELLYELFLQAAPLEKVKIPTDRDGRPGTYGFVTCSHAESVPYAIGLLNGIALFERKLNLKPRSNPQGQQAAKPQRSLHEMVLSGLASVSNAGKRNSYEYSPVARRQYDHRNDRQEYRRNNRYDFERHRNYMGAPYNKRRLRLSN